MVLGLCNFFFTATLLFTRLSAQCVLGLSRAIKFPPRGSLLAFTSTPEKDRFVELKSARRARPFCSFAFGAGLFSFCVGVFIIYTNSSKALMRECIIQRPRLRHGPSKNACANKQRLLMPLHWQPGTTFSLWPLANFTLSPKHRYEMFELHNLNSFNIELDLLRGLTLQFSTLMLWLIIIYSKPLVAKVSSGSLLTRWLIFN